MLTTLFGWRGHTRVDLETHSKPGYKAHQSQKITEKEPNFQQNQLYVFKKYLRNVYRIWHKLNVECWNGSVVSICRWIYPCRNYKLNELREAYWNSWVINNTYTTYYIHQTSQHTHLSKYFTFFWGATIKRVSRIRGIFTSSSFGLGTYSITPGETSISLSMRRLGLLLISSNMGLRSCNNSISNPRICLGK